MNVGCDIVMISRVKDALAHTPGFPNFLSEHERAQFEALKGQRQAEWLAGRFAAKEAIVKAMHGVQELHICDIEIRSDDSGAPVCTLPGIRLSIAHEREYAVAFALYIG